MFNILFGKFLRQINKIILIYCFLRTSYCVWLSHFEPVYKPFLYFAQAFKKLNADLVQISSHFQPLKI